MKKIFFTLLCAAVMISCGGNKEQATACDGNHTECTHQHDECDGNHEDCTGECENGVGECDHCASKGEAEKCTNQEAGVVVLDTETFIKKVADINNPEWKYLGDKPAVIDFYADWCGPCKIIAPALEEIAKEYAGNVNVYKVNVDLNKGEGSTTPEYGITEKTYKYKINRLEEKKVKLISMRYRKYPNLVKTMKNAIKEAGIEPSEVTYINAHGTSTHLNDKFETMAVKNALGEASKTVMMSSTKGHTGHLLGAAGGVEAVVCIKAIETGIVPPTIGYKVPDEECDLDIVPNVGRNQKVEYAMSNSLGFGGHNGTLIFKKVKED